MMPHLARFDGEEGLLAFVPRFRAKEKQTPATGGTT
jgi:hypothetical protein